MLLLADRNYAAADLITAFAATGAHLLIRCKNGRTLPPIHRCHDGSWLSVIGSQRIRVMARISITTTNGSYTGDYRLITTLLDAHRYPAADGQVDGGMVSGSCLMGLLGLLGAKFCPLP
ncbi:hypothetical protein ACFY2R_13175 [Micromonospora olivasterospora]|uniref:DDE family transposase n=1 Tax=Micromonospora olivasterospora TaxID=1880 RepID=A0A562IB71_MICOL|nr:hypothetical protein [Micromonospora olivasterospora]TWH67965.1 hypothetical protein JD77_02952 [Micromonospora olivasterospora]